MQLINVFYVSDFRKKGKFMFKKYFLLFTILVLISSSVMAKDGGGAPDAPPVPGEHTPPDNPIDGGLGILLVLGIGYGVKKLREKE